MPRIRVLVVGHTYVVAENQKKLYALADASIDLALVVPRRWRDDLTGPIDAAVPAAAPFRVTPLPTIGAGREQFYVYRSSDVGLRRFRPDVLLVEQGAGSLVYTQSLIYRALHAPRAKAVFFTWWNLPYRARWPLSAIEQFNLRRSQGAVAGNADAAAILRDHGFNGPLLVLPQLGVDAVTFRPDAKAARRMREQLGLTRFTVGFAGRLVEEKGLGVLLSAIAGLAAPIDLLVVGRGPFEPDLRAAAAAPGWPHRLTMVGAVNHSDVPSYLNAMDVLVLPSLTRPPVKEQFGHVLVEAMACGVPVVGSQSGEIPHVIGDAGQVVPEGDAMALRAALDALAGSVDRRHDAATLGRQRVVERFTHTRIAEQLRDFLQAL